MTKATRDTTKLNFITDQGSTRATVRCACRAVRLDDFFLGPAFLGTLRGEVFRSSPTAVLPAPAPVISGARERRTGGRGARGRRARGRRARGRGAERRRARGQRGRRISGGRLGRGHR